MGKISLNTGMVANVLDKRDVCLGPWTSALQAANGDEVKGHMFQSSGYK